MTEYLKYGDCRGRQITLGTETLLSNHINDTDVHLSEADRSKLDSIINPDDVVSTSDLATALDSYYTKTEIDDKAFVDSSYLVTNKYITEEYLENHDAAKHYTKTEVDLKIANVLPGNNVTVDNSFITVNAGSKIKLSMDDDEISLVIYTPILAALSCSRTTYIEWDTTPSNVTLTITLANGDSGNQATLESTCTTAPSVTTFTVSGTTEAAITKNDITTYTLKYKDSQSSEKQVTTSVRYAKAIVYGTEAITSTNFFNLSDKLTKKLVLSAKGQDITMTQGTGEFGYFACPKDWEVSFTDGKFTGGWSKTATEFTPYTGITYSVYKTNNSGLGKVNWATNK